MTTLHCFSALDIIQLKNVGHVLLKLVKNPAVGKIISYSCLYELLFIIVLYFGLMINDNTGHIDRFAKPARASVIFFNYTVFAR